jgi:cellulose synthase operon protein C
MKRLPSFFLVPLILGIVCSRTVAFPQESGPLEQANAALRSGNYLEARALYAPLLRSATGDDREDVMGFFETFLARGEYLEGMSLVDSCLTKNPEDPWLLHMKGRFLETTGDYDGAVKTYYKAGIIKQDYLRDLLDLGELLEKSGRKREAGLFYQWIADNSRQSGGKTVRSIGIAARALADQGNFVEANRQFKSAHDLDPGDIQNLLWWGDLFREKYNDADARQTFEEALDINPHSAELMMGYARTFESVAQWEALANAALAENPNSVEALNVLARVSILDGKYDDAEQGALRTLAIDPMSEGALANLATVHHLRGEPDSLAMVEQRAEALNPQCGGFYLTIAENCTWRFRYRDAADFCRRAITVESDNWRAYTLLGSNVLRLGRTDEARGYVQKAYDGDPFDIFARNMLELLDDYANFITAESDHFSLMVNSTESGVLARPILALAEECYDSLRVRYSYVPGGKIRLEAYNDHDDFAVRISGLPGIGLLGVCFGDVVAFDTPRAQTGSDYNWADTLWHEITHVMSLGMSDGRVPRWFTEGLSVYEEQRENPEWGRDSELDFFVALDQNALLPLRDIDKGFTRPEYSSQTVITYYHSSRVIGYLAGTYGFRVIPALLVEYGRGSDTEKAFMAVLGKTPEQIQEGFLSSLEKERAAYAPVVANMPRLKQEKPVDGQLAEKVNEGVNPFFTVIREGFDLLGKKDYDAAEAKFLDAIGIFPGYAGKDSPWRGLAAVYIVRGDEKKLMEALERYLSLTNYGGAEAVVLAGFLEKNGDAERAGEYYRRSFETVPYDIAAHERLADLYRESGLYPSETEERKVVLALNPLDLSRAHYDLALSLYREHRPSEAEREVLRSLEIAPGFRDAQKLLLKCTGN